MLLLIILLVLLFGGGGGYYGYSRWGSRGGLRIGRTILLILVIVHAGGLQALPTSYLLHDFTTAESFRPG